MQQFIALSVWPTVHEGLAREREAEARRERLAAQARGGHSGLRLFRALRWPRLPLPRAAARTRTA